MTRATLFRQLVQQRHWTVYETFNTYFQRAARQLAEHEGDPQLATVAVSRRSFDRWMAGDLKRMPWPSTRRVLEYLLGEPATKMFGVPEEPAAVTPDARVRSSGVSRRWPNQITLPAEATSAELADPPVNICPPGSTVDENCASAPRADSAASPLTQKAPAIPVHEVEQVEFDEPLEIVTQARSLTSSNVAPALLSMAAASIRRIVDRYEALGPRLLAGETRLLRKLLHSVLDGQQPPRARTELFSLAGRAAGLLGYMAVNAGAPFAVTDAYCMEAEDLAREAGDTALQMWAAGTRSLGLYYASRYAEADDAAQAGIGLAPQNPQAIRLLVNGRARALARLGDRPGTERAIGQAMELSDRGPSLPDGLTSCIDFAPYSVARSLANAVTARLSLGDTADVLNYAARIDDLIERSDSEWSRALVRLDVATALLQQDHPDVEHAMALGRSALHASTTAPIRSVWQRATELYDHASRWHDEPEVGDYAEELRMWRSEPQARPIVTGSCVGTAL